MRKIKLGAGAFDALSAAVRGSVPARQHHRIHAVLLVAGGMSCRAAARLLGDSPRAVGYWVKRYKSNNIKGLIDNRSPGRPPRLTAAQAAELRAALRSAPPGGACGWTGLEVSELVSRNWGVALGLRQAQRLLSKMREN